jgi:hypothetical protein
MSWFILVSLDYRVLESTVKGLLDLRHAFPIEKGETACELLLGEIIDVLGGKTHLLVVTLLLLILPVSMNGVHTEYVAHTLCVQIPQNYTY